MKNYLFFLVTLFFGLNACQHSSSPTGPESSSFKAPPKFNITSHVDQERVSGFVDIIATPQTTDAISFIELIVDGIRTGVKDFESPWELPWDTTTLENGSEHTIRVRSVNREGAFTESDPITLILANPPSIKRVVFKDNSFLISWTPSVEPNFNSYTLYESRSENMDAKQEIYSTTFRNNNSFVVEGIQTDQKRYYQVITNNADGKVSESNIRRGSSFVNIAFVSSRDGNFEIYIMDIDGENKANLTNHRGWDTNPVFSPDGNKIAFFSNRDGAWGIFIMDIDGSNLLKIADKVSWNGIQEFSPDGSKLVYVGEIGSKQNIFVVDIDGSNRTRLTNHAGADFSPIFTPDGNRIIYARNDNSGNIDVFSMNVRGGAQTNLSNDGSSSSPTISPDGATIAFDTWRLAPVPRIYLMDNDGGNQVNISKSANPDEGPVFSPDGTRILFLSRQTLSDSNFDVYIVNLDGSDRINLSNSSGGNFDPQFSGDGQQVVFTSSRNGFGNIYKINIDGSNLTQLTFDGSGDKKPVFQPRS